MATLETRGTAPDRVGVRELRQNLSVYLARVQAGEALTVTEHGRVVAMLVPVAAESTPLERLVAAGRATGPTTSLSTLGPPRGKPSNRFSRLLEEMRNEERY